MAIVKDFQVNNGLEVAVNANVVGNTTSLDYLANVTGSTIAPSITFDFARAKVIDSRLTFARSSNATYRAVNGLVAYAQTNEPRFNYNSNGVCQGILVEKGSTNDVLYSTNVGNTNFWSIGGGDNSSMAIALNNATAPDGSKTASLFYHNTSVVTYKSCSFGFTAQSNRPYTHSFFVKSNGEPFVYVVHYDGLDSLNTINFKYYFANNTLTGVSTSGSANCAVINGPAVEPYADGWVRLSYTYHYTTGTSRFLQIKTDLDSATAVVGRGYYLWGHQHEWNDKLTSFIPTTTTSATRAYDYLYCVDDARGNNLTSWFNVNQGTIAIDWNVNSTGPNANNTIASAYSGYPGPYVFWKSDGDGANVLTHLFYADTGAAKTLGLEQFNNNAWIFSQGIGVSVANNVTLKTVVGYSTNNISWTTSGAAVVGGTPNLATPPTTTRLDLGRCRANWLDGHIKTFKYWPTKLANTDILNTSLV